MVGHAADRADKVIECIVLAAGQGTRMRAGLPKVAHRALGKPLVFWSLDALRKASFGRATVVVSPTQTIVHGLLEEYGHHHADFSVTHAVQHQAQGTGHATRCAFESIRERAGDALSPGIALIVTGDTPLLRPGTLRAFVAEHEASGAVVSLIAFETVTPKGYGRVLTGDDGAFLAIREEKDCSPDEKRVTLCNSGIMCIALERMADLLGRLDAKNAAGEYYLTDVPGHAAALGEKVGIFRGGSEEEFAGVNTQLQLSTAAQILQERILEDWMERGVVFEDPRLVFVEDGVTFGRDVVVEPFVCLRGERHIPDGTRVRSGEGIHI